jgi:hypothetical protein
MIGLDMEAELRCILDEIGDQLPSVDHENIKNFIEHGEWALAVETLCDQVGEREAVLSKATYERIMGAASSLRIDDRYRRAVPSPTRDPNLGHS